MYLTMFVPSFMKLDQLMYIISISLIDLREALIIGLFELATHF
jgi:hypothetical protein